MRIQFLSIFLMALFFCFTEPVAAQTACHKVHAEQSEEAAFKAEAKQSRFAKILTRILVPKVVLVDRLLTPRDFYTSKKGEVIVGISGDTSNTFTHKYNKAQVDYLRGSSYADNKKVFSLEVKSPHHLISSLRSIYDRAGPIKRLALFGHGFSGNIDIGGINVNKRWAEQQKELLRSLPHDLFEKDAEVILLSCSIGSGYSIAPNYGTNAIQRIFSNLLKQGGKVVASRHTVTGTARTFEDPLAQQAVQETDAHWDSLSKGKKAAFYATAIPMFLAIETERLLAPLVKDWKTLFREDISIVEIPPAKPKEMDPSLQSAEFKAITPRGVQIDISPDFKSFNVIADGSIQATIERPQEIVKVVAGYDPSLVAVLERDGAASFFVNGTKIRHIPKSQDVQISDLGYLMAASLNSTTGKKAVILNGITGEQQILDLPEDSLAADLDKRSQRFLNVTRPGGVEQVWF